MDSCPIDQLPPKEALPAAPLVIAAYSVAWIVDLRLHVVDLAAARQRREGDGGAQPARRRGGAAVNGNMTSAHFIFIPAVLLIGVVIGWVLGSRAAADAYGAELKRRRRAAAEVAAVQPN